MGSQPIPFLLGVVNELLYLLGVILYKRSLRNMNSLHTTNDRSTYCQFKSRQTKSSREIHCFFQYRHCMKFTLLLPTCFCMLFSLTLFYFSFFYFSAWLFCMNIFKIFLKYFWNIFKICFRKYINILLCMLFNLTCALFILVLGYLCMKIFKNVLGIF